MSERRIVSLHHARQMVVSSFIRTPIECVPTMYALNRILAEDIRADEDMPNLPEATRDGYAVVSFDTISANHDSPVHFGILNDSTSTSKSTLLPGTALYVQSGDLLPPGADAVVPKTSTFREHESPTVLVLNQIEKGDGIRSAGWIAAAGDILIPNGTRIAPRHLGVLGLWGIKSIRVASKPRIKVVFSTASKNSNMIDSVTLWLGAMLDRSGGVLADIQSISPGRLPVVEMLSKDNSEVDITLIVLDNGQPSDPVINAMRYKSKLLFERILMTPSGPVAFGTKSGHPVLLCGMSNLDAIVESLVHPALYETTGSIDTGRKLIAARSASTLKVSSGSTSVLRASVEYVEGSIWVRPMSNRAPWTSPSEHVDGYIVLPEDSTPVRRGDLVDFLQITH